MFPGLKLMSYDVIIYNVIKVWCSGGRNLKGGPKLDSWTELTELTMEMWSNLDGHVDLAQLYGNVSFMSSFPSNCGKSRCTWSRALLDLAQWNSNSLLLCTVSPLPYRVMWSYSPSRAIPQSKMDANIMTHHDTFICESFMWRCLFQCFALTSTSFKLHVWTHPPRAFCGDPPWLLDCFSRDYGIIWDTYSAQPWTVR